MAMQKITLGTVMTIAVIGMIATALGALTASQTFRNTGSVSVKTVGVSVYSDSQCTSKITSLDWGTLSPGSQTTKTIYIKNEGSASITLSMTYGNWNPSGASVITLSWNRQGATLAAGSSISATLTLTVPASITGVTSFSFDITITGTETT